MVEWIYLEGNLHGVDNSNARFGRCGIAVISFWPLQSLLLSSPE